MNALKSQLWLKGKKFCLCKQNFFPFSPLYAFPCSLSLKTDSFFHLRKLDFIKIYFIVSDLSDFNTILLKCLCQFN